MSENQPLVGYTYDHDFKMKFQIVSSGSDDISTITSSPNVPFVAIETSVIEAKPPKNAVIVKNGYISAATWLQILLLVCMIVDLIVFLVGIAQENVIGMYVMWIVTEGAVIGLYKCMELGMASEIQRRSALHEKVDGQKLKMEVIPGFPTKERAKPFYVLAILFFASGLTMNILVSFHDIASAFICWFVAMMSFALPFVYYWNHVKTEQSEWMNRCSYTDKSFLPMFYHMEELSPPTAFASAIDPIPWGNIVDFKFVASPEKFHQAKSKHNLDSTTYTVIQYRQHQLWLVIVYRVEIEQRTLGIPISVMHSESPGKEAYCCGRERRFKTVHGVFYEEVDLFCKALVKYNPSMETKCAEVMQFLDKELGHFTIKLK